METKNMTMKYPYQITMLHIIFTIIISTCLFFKSADISYAEGLDVGMLTPEEKLDRDMPLSVGEKLEFVKNQFTAGPCHLNVKPKYYQSFPPWKVGAHNLNSGYKIDGKVNSDTYKSARFLPITKQRYGFGEKRYYLPAFYFDFEKSKEPEFVGFISFFVAQKIETYVPKKHKSWNASTPRDQMLASWYVRPLHRTQVPIYDRKLMKIIGYRNIIVYENCWPAEIHPVTGFTPQGLRNAYPDFPINPKVYKGIQVLYGPEDAPTLYAYHDLYKEVLNANVKHYDSLYNGVVVAKDIYLSALPVVGTSMSFYQCLNQSDPACWAGVALDAVSDAAFVLKIGKVQKVISKLGPTLSRTADGQKIATSLNKFADRTLYVAAYGNAGLGGFYLSRGKVLEGAARLAAGSFDVYSTHAFNGRIYGGRVGEKPDCAGPPTKLEGEDTLPGSELPSNQVTIEHKNIDTGEPSLHVTTRGVHREIVEPPHVISERDFIKEIELVREKSPGSFDEPAIQLVRRVDRRTPSTIIDEGGMYPKSNRPEGDAIQHLERQSRKFTSTTYADDVEHLIREDLFFPYDNRVNYKTNDEIYEAISKGSGISAIDLKTHPDKYGIEWHKTKLTLSGDIKIPWGKTTPPPEPMRFQTFEYEANTLAAKSNVDLVEQEAITRGVRADEITKARKITLSYSFTRETDFATGQTYLSIDNWALDMKVEYGPWQDIGVLFRQASP